ncbi:MAG: hypothetical protein RLZZ200_1325 [Pseudomonadota bacterium]|jgi:hypothetical protein
MMTPDENQFSFAPNREGSADSTQRNLPRLTLDQDSGTDSGARGWNPYDRDPTRETRNITQRTDLRKLSEWIKLQKQAEARKNAAANET